MSRDQPTEGESMEDGSEFGRGVVICLAKFSEHLNDRERWRHVGSDVTYQIEMAMNAASDHFYDLDREHAPACLCELADLTLEMGHGFSRKTWTEEDWKRVRRLWKQSCIEIDKQLGLSNIDWGEW